MGGNVGGPILLPFTDFNKSRKKLFFWAGYEYMDQHPAASPINYNVPTAEQLSGDFSETTINGVPGRSGIGLRRQYDTLKLPCKRRRLAVRLPTPYNLPTWPRTK